MVLCVFCGSSFGNSDIYRQAATNLGHILAGKQIELVFGGGRVGLMGALADAVLEKGGHAIGIVPRSLVEREIVHSGLSALHIVDSMHERKALMAEMSSGFIALPGGAGTLEEMLEQWTWAQLGIHEKPCGFLNVGGYFDPLKKMINTMTDEGFLSPVYSNCLIWENKAEQLLTRLHEYSPPLQKWT